MVNQVKVWGQMCARKGAVEKAVQLWKAKREAVGGMVKYLILRGLKNITKVRQLERNQQAGWKISRVEDKK
jgi:hypothetical protein